MATHDGRQTAEGFPIAFRDDGGVIVNFGLLAGREATQAELDRLARSLRDAGASPEITLTAARRQGYGPGGETVVHQVHVEVGEGPAMDTEQLCTDWARECAAERSVEPLG